MTPEQAAEKYHWIKYDKENKLIEIFLDHHSLSGARQCEAAFFMEHLLHISPNYGQAEQSFPKIPVPTNSNIDQEIEAVFPITKSRKPWSLEFGEYLHYCNEYFYTHFKKYQKPPEMFQYLKTCRFIWDKMDMEWYKSNGYSGDQEKYADVHGWEGVSSLLSQYYIFYMDMRLRVIDTEITFGYNREVLIGEFDLNIGNKVDGDIWVIVKCYLTGRIDLLIDNGHKVGPVDHKHTHKFKGDEWTKYNPHDAITGYILAIRCIMKTLYPKYFEEGHECLSAWVYHISACTPSVPRDKSKKQQERFKATPIDKTLSQLEDFKARQLSTFKRIAELLFNNKIPEWNTMACDNMFNRKCKFKPIHEAPSEEWQNIIKSHFVIGEAWNPKNVSNKVNIDEIFMRQEKDRM